MTDGGGFDGRESFWWLIECSASILGHHSRELAFKVWSMKSGYQWNLVTISIRHKVSGILYTTDIYCCHLEYLDDSLG